MKSPANDIPLDEEPLASYWQQTKRPLVCLAFVAPMLLVYEGGVLLFGSNAARNGVDVYLRYLLDTAGFGQYFLLPGLTAFILLGWHHTTGQPWQIRPATLLGMGCESMGMAVALVIVARLQSTLLPPQVASFITCEVAAGQGEAGRLIGYFGAGIYEELLFRLMLLPAVAAVFCYCGATRRTGLAGAILVTSFLFSAAHYQLFTFSAEGDPWQWYSFIFRCTAGLIFALLFVYRGFGVAAGTHALYDILVQLFA